MRNTFKTIWCRFVPFATISMMAVALAGCHADSIGSMVNEADATVADVEASAPQQSIDKTAVNETLRASAQAFRSCYVGAVTAGSTANGKLVAKVTILPDSSTAVTFISNETHSDTLTDCIAAEIEILEFPQVSRSTEFKVPFVFRSN